MKNSRRLFLGLICFLVATFGLISQDVITYMDGSTIEVNVLEVGDKEVKFTIRKDGHPLSMDIDEIFMIHYGSGEKHIIDHSEEIAEEVEGYDDYQYSGPKVGMTVLGNGSANDYLEERGHGLPIISQFGWQFETRLFTLEDKTSGLVEWILLAGGLEKGLFLPSASMIFGIRSGRNGLEVGVGPNLSLSGFGMAFAAGGSVPYGKINVPINLAVVPSVNQISPFDASETRKPTGFRVSLLVGFNTRVH